MNAKASEWVATNKSSAAIVNSNNLLILNFTSSAFIKIAVSNSSDAENKFKNEIPSVRYNMAAIEAKPSIDLVIMISKSVPLSFILNVYITKKNAATNQDRANKQITI